MAITYNVYKSNNDLLAQVPDGEIDKDSATITLIGKNYAGYGNVQNHNFVHMVEHFAANTAPDNPLEGQLWWNTESGNIQVYTDSNWKVLSQTVSSITAPTNPKIGDVWYDLTTEQFKVYNGTEWVVVGPFFTKDQGLSGVIPLTVYDTSNNPHTILRVMSGTSPNVYAIFSKDPTFTLKPANSEIAGFSILSPGLTLVDPSAIPDVKINGYATLESPIFTGTPTAPTPANIDVSTKLATTQYVDNRISILKDGVIPQLDTLNELALAINNDPLFAENTYANINQANLRITNLNNAFVANISRLDTTLGVFISNVDTRVSQIYNAINNISLTPGPQGPQGLSGFSGYSGISGWSGMKGDSGSPGVTVTRLDQLDDVQIPGGTSAVGAGLVLKKQGTGFWSSDVDREGTAQAGNRIWVQTTTPTSGQGNEGDIWIVVN